MHLRALDHKTLWTLVNPRLKAAGIECPQDPGWVDRALSVFKTSMETLEDAKPRFQPIDDRLFSIKDDAAEVFTWESTKKVLAAWKQALQSAPDFMTGEDFEKLQNGIKDSCGVKGKHLFMPIRVAVIGQPHGAELKILVPLLHKNSLLKRVEECLRHG
jgi:nondiscriminating glutamyl-tRNA synthetase